MNSINRAIVNASNELISVLAAEHPELDTRLLPRRVQELMKNIVTNQSCQGVSVTASDAPVTVNTAADALVLAHVMFTEGDKANASRMIAFAFNQPDCFSLMSALSELNEEADPQDLDELFDSISPAESNIADTDPVALPANTEITGDPTISENPPASLLESVDDTDSAINSDMPADAAEILADLDIAPTNLSTGIDDSDKSNLDDDSALGIDLDTSAWNIGGGSFSDDPLMTNFEPSEDNDGLGGGGNGAGIDGTASGNANPKMSPNDSSLGLDPGLNATQEILAKITDPTVKAVINQMSMDKSKPAQAKLRAFINLYTSRHF